MLKFDEVTKEFQDGNHTIEAVKPTSLSFEKGELIAIVGPSGSGKSTFLTMVGYKHQHPVKYILMIRKSQNESETIS